MSTAKRTTPPNPFSAALKTAEKDLAAKQKERTTASKVVMRLNTEIPALENTVRALKQQLNPKGYYAIPLPTVGGNGTNDAPNLHEVPEGAGSIPAPPLDPRAVDLNAIPGMEDGEWV